MATYKKAPAIHGFGWRRKRIKGECKPQVKDPFRTNHNRAMKEEKKMLKSKSQNQ